MHLIIIKWSAIIAGIMIVIAVITAVVCSAIVTSSAEGRLYSDPKETPEYDTALLLGTSPRSRYVDAPNLFFANRINATARLYKAGKIHHILISASGCNDEGINECEAMRDSLIARGVPADIMTLDGEGTRTIFSVINAKKIYHLTSFIVISQKFHNERAIYQATHLGFDKKNIAGFNADDVYTSTSWITYVREYLARVKVLLEI